jgi:uncharacterized protein (DUF2062 family)
MSRIERIRGWAKRNMPHRETFEKIVWLRPVAHRILAPELWRFTRRSVPRGVALGMLVGILIPVAQTLFAAFFALPVRANVPVAALTTFVTNPITTPPIWAFAYWVGLHFLSVDKATTGGIVAEQFRPEAVGWFAWAIDWLQWLIRDAGPALLVGLVIVAIIGAAIGYLLAAFGWRWWIAHKWKQRALTRNLRGD